MSPEERQARIARAVREGAESLARAHSVVAEARLRAMRSVLLRIATGYAAELAHQHPEVDTMGDAELLEWVLVNLRPMVADLLKNGPS